MHTYRVLIEGKSGATLSEAHLTVRDVDRAQELAVGLLARDLTAEAVDIFEGGRRLARITRADPKQA
ncbi:MAG: hypothetical protein ACHP7N_00740 [Caulobacterales bacterium]